MPEDIRRIIQELLDQEDTNKDFKITIEDKGPKTFSLYLNGKEIVVKGNYQISNLLQELVLLEKENNTIDHLDFQKIEELPVNRISRIIREYFWDGLTRRIDEDGLEKIATDIKSNSEKIRIYLSPNDEDAISYFTSLQTNNKLNLEVAILPNDITSEYVNSINDKPGILGLALQKNEGQISGKPFIVPGSRFNEMYGWDSYFNNIGLLLDGKKELAKSVVENFQYEIEHYGKILNANRSYYLTRTQPPFFSSMIKEVFEAFGNKDIEWLESMLKTCILEYETVWMNPQTHLCENGLNRYFATGFGMPWETEKGHFDAILQPFADKLGYDLEQFTELYKRRQISVPELDDYFVHDRTVRESGHDTTYRLEGICADIQPVELNCMLYKYETDLTELISKYFENGLRIQDKDYNSEYFKNQAERRKNLIDTYLWDEEAGMYFDYHFKKNEKHDFWSATGFFPLWIGICSDQQMHKLKENLKKFIFPGGIVSSLYQTPKDMPQRQWDFPIGWAPHQIIIWKGLERYGETSLLQNCVYNWLWNITKIAHDYNGVIVEKYDVVNASHKVDAEYGNQGTEFSYISSEGFGWTNASYQLGLKLLHASFIPKLNQLQHPKDLKF